LPWFGMRDSDEDVPVLYPFIMRVGTIDAYVMVLKIDLVNYRETLISILTYLNSKGVDIFHIIRGPAEGKGRAVTYMLVLNLSRASINIESLKIELGKIEGVKAVSVGGEKLLDIMLFTRAFPLYTFERSIILGVTFLRALFNSFNAYFHQPALAASTLYQLGFRTGFTLTKELSELTKHEGEALIRDVFDFLKAHGVGSFEYKTSGFPHSSEVVIRVSQGIEALASNMPAPRCHFTRGLLSGMMSYIMGSYVPMQEVKCVGKGDKYCVFVGSKKSKTKKTLS